MAKMLTIKGETKLTCLRADRINAFTLTREKENKILLSIFIDGDKVPYEFYFRTWEIALAEKNKIITILEEGGKAQGEAAEEASNDRRD